MTAQGNPIFEDKPIAGYYRYRRHREAKWEPAVVFEHDGALVCRISDRMVDVYETWTWVAGNKMPKADVLFAFANGGAWPGDAPAPIGSNHPPSDDPFEQLSRELEAEQIRVTAWIAEPHEGKTAADMAANWLADLRKLEKKTEAAFDAEKAPVLAETKRIDIKWRGLKALAAQIKKAMDDRFQEIGRKEKKRQQDVADAQARAEAEARRKQLEADQDKKAALAKEHGIQLELEEKLAEPVVLAAPPVKVNFGGAQGSRVAVKKRPATALVEDWPKAAAYYAGNAKLRECVQKLADHDARDGRDVPGAQIIPGE